MNDKHPSVDTDTRNVIDDYRGKSIEAIVEDLDLKRTGLHIAVENIERDFNMGTIIRNANAFNVERIHIIGRRQWNKRGAMKTDAYMHIDYHLSVESFIEAMNQHNRQVIAIDIVEGARNLHDAPLPKKAVLVFGSEGAGLSQELLKSAQEIVCIEQFGSTRSVNVGVASGIAMYAWMQRYWLTQ